MFSNFLEISSDKISTRHCYLLADFFEAQAAQLRRLAAEKHRQKFDDEEAKSTKINAQQQVILAGQKTHELVKSGVNKSDACNLIATNFHLKAIHVEAHLNKFLSREKADNLNNRKNDILKLSKAGHSTRQIAANLEIPKSTVAVLIKREKFILEHKATAIAQRKKGIRAAEIAKRFDCPLNIVLDMLEEA